MRRFLFCCAWGTTEGEIRSPQIAISHYPRFNRRSSTCAAPPTARVPTASAAGSRARSADAARPDAPRRLERGRAALPDQRVGHGAAQRFFRPGRDEPRRAAGAARAAPRAARAVDRRAADAGGARQRERVDREGVGAARRRAATAASSASSAISRLGGLSSFCATTATTLVRWRRHVMQMPITRHHSRRRSLGRARLGCRCRGRTG